jgi:hypothetical protein
VLGRSQRLAFIREAKREELSFPRALDSSRSAFRFVAVSCITSGKLPSPPQLAVIFSFTAR